MFISVFFFISFIHLLINKFIYLFIFRMNECWVSLLPSVSQVFDPVQEIISCLCVRSSIQLRHPLFYLCNSHGERVYIVLKISNLDLAAAYAQISQKPEI